MDAFEREGYYRDQEASTASNDRDAYGLSYGEYVFDYNLLVLYFVLDCWAYYNSLICVGLCGVHTVSLISVGLCGVHTVSLICVGLCGVHTVSLICVGLCGVHAVSLTCGWAMSPIRRLAVRVLQVWCVL